jgi:hypothetical protein
MRMMLCLLIVSITSSAWAQQPKKPAAKPASTSTPTVPENAVWKSAWELAIEGKGWFDTLAPYDRFPARAQGVVPASVWGLSRTSAGISVRLVTDAPAIYARWTVASDKSGFAHMAALGVSGLDLYARDPMGAWRWVGFGKPTGPTSVERLTASGFQPARREYMVYFPLYNGTVKLEIGVPPGHRLEPGPMRPADRLKPIVFYGTSITHGASATRPGMVHTAILGRRLDRPVINLGFSGNGRMDESVVDLLAELDAAVYVIDCCPNMTPDLVAQRTEPLVRRLRAARPDTPIILVEDREYSDNWVNPDKAARNTGNHAELKAAFDRLTAAGVQRLHYIPGRNLLGSDNEATADSSHPTDLGFWRQADAFEPVLRKALEP